MANTTPQTHIISYASDSRLPLITPRRRCPILMLNPSLLLPSAPPSPHWSGPTLIVFNGAARPSVSPRWRGETTTTSWLLHAGDSGQYLLSSTMSKTMYTYRTSTLKISDCYEFEVHISHCQVLSKIFIRHFCKKLPRPLQQIEERQKVVNLPNNLRSLIEELLRILDFCIWHCFT